MSMWCWVISHFCDFSSFWCMAVKTMDKLQFLSFIFAALLSITVHFIALRIGRPLCISTQKFCWILCEWFSRYHVFNFLDSNWPECWIVKRVQFYLLRRPRGLRHITMPNFVKTGPSLADILQFFNFINGRHPQCEFSKWWNFIGSRAQTAKAHHCCKFSQNRSINCEDNAIYPPPSWIFEFMKFYWRTIPGGSSCFTVQNCIKISSFAANILQFFEFLRWLPQPILIWYDTIW